MRASNSVPENPSMERRQTTTSGRARAAASIARSASEVTSTTRSGSPMAATRSVEISPAVSQSSTDTEHVLFVSAPKGAG